MLLVHEQNAKEIRLFGVRVAILSSGENDMGKHKATLPYRDKYSNWEQGNVFTIVFVGLLRCQDGSRTAKKRISIVSLS